MSKTYVIEGMTDSSCCEKIEKMLNAVEGVYAKVNIESATAFVDGEISDRTVSKIVENAGFSVAD